MHIGVCALAMAVLAMASVPAAARSDFLDLDAAAALASDHGENLLPDVAVFMIGQESPRIERELGKVSYSRRSRSIGRSDESACQRAFVSALIALQAHTKKLKGDAVTDIVSVTKQNTLESPTLFRCVVGGVVAQVVLNGKVVKLQN